MCLTENAPIHKSCETCRRVHDQSTVTADTGASSTECRLHANQADGGQWAFETRKFRMILIEIPPKDHP